MKTRTIVALVAMLTLLAFATTALAADGTLTVSVKNKAGVLTAGTVYATRSGYTTKTCTATSGKCNLSLATGSWTIYAKNSAGAKTAAKTKSVVGGANAVEVNFP